MDPIQEQLEPQINVEYLQDAETNARYEVYNIGNDNLQQLWYIDDASMLSSNCLTAPEQSTKNCTAGALSTDTAKKGIAGFLRDDSKPSYQDQYIKFLESQYKICLRKYSLRTSLNVGLSSAELGTFIVAKKPK